MTMGFPFQPVIALGQKTGDWGKLREGTCKAQSSRCWASFPCAASALCTPVISYFAKVVRSLHNGNICSCWRNMDYWPGPAQDPPPSWNNTTLNVYCHYSIPSWIHTSSGLDISQKNQKALGKKSEYLVFQMPTLFSLTLVVGISCSQLLREVWTETQIHKVFFTLEDKSPPFSLLCLCHLSHWGCCSKTQFARKPFYSMENAAKWGSKRQWRPFSLFPCPLDRCNHPMWDLAGVME